MAAEAVTPPPHPPPPSRSPTFLCPSPVCPHSRVPHPHPNPRLPQPNPNPQIRAAPLLTPTPPRLERLICVQLLPARCPPPPLFQPPINLQPRTAEEVELSMCEHSPYLPVFLPGLELRSTPPSALGTPLLGSKNWAAPVSATLASAALNPFLFVCSHANPKQGTLEGKQPWP